MVATNNEARAASARGWHRPAGGQPHTYHVRHDPAGSATLTTTLVHALADAMGEDVTDVGFSLADTIDPDALDRIFAQRGRPREQPAGHIAFSVEGYQVTVYSTGEIVITPPADPAMQSPHR